MGKLEQNPWQGWEVPDLGLGERLGHGLSICRSIVEAHGGRLWATPTEPHGAVFRILLPVESKTRRDEA
jgi:K+-sensing histidine kinase KdpD